MLVAAGELALVVLVALPVVASEVLAVVLALALVAEAKVDMVAAVVVAVQAMVVVLNQWALNLVVPKAVINNLQKN